MTIGARLKEEREKLGYSQTAFGDLAGVKKNTLIQWEKDASSPPALALSAFAEAGADILYIVTGQRAVGFDGSGPSASFAEAVMDEIDAKGMASPGADYEAKLGVFALDPGLPDRTRARADRLLARQGDEAAKRRIADRDQRLLDALEKARTMVRQARFVVDWEPPERLDAELVRLVAYFGVDSRQIEDLMRVIRDLSTGKNGTS